MSRILIVEDEADIALGLEDDLTMDGHDVEVVRDGETACRRGREGAWDVILLDVMLPGKDGFEVCRELRSGGVQTPIIMLTAKVQEAEKVLGLELGADDCDKDREYNKRKWLSRLTKWYRRRVERLWIAFSWSTCFSVDSRHLTQCTS